MNKASEHNKIIIENLNKLIGEKFGNYSKYIIQERALPDLRDGLKPVQRRILFSMSELNLSHRTAYKKSARVVGDVIGKYHPHGDSSVYDAMVRMSQEWKMNLPLVDMHGNKGSIDGDSAAAMRYTEARLSKISAHILGDIKKNVVKFAPNFDDSELEPTVLPSMFPNLLVNGAVGIASGYSTNIPPHNFNEIIRALIFVLKNDGFTLTKLLTYIKGPDFPTGGTLVKDDEIKKIYRTGKGKLTVQAKYEYVKEKKEIRITQIPFEANKAEIVRRIDEFTNDKRIAGIDFVRDDSDRKGLLITIKINPGFDYKKIITYLFKNTDLEKKYYINLVAIKNKKPELLSLVDIFSAFKDFQIQNYRNVYTYELNKLNKRLEIVNALMRVVAHIDVAILIIRNSLNKAEAKMRIMSRFIFNENQAEAIVNLRLYRLTSTDINELKSEQKQLKRQISHYEKCLNKQEYLTTQIVNDLNKISEEFNFKRKTAVEEITETVEISQEDLINKEEVYFGVSRDGYLKKVSIQSKERSNENNYGLRDGDFDIMIKKVSNLDKAFIFTSNGRYYMIPIYKLKQSTWKEIGEHVSVFTPITGKEKIIRVVIGHARIKQGRYLVSTTKNGLVKKTEVSKLTIPITKAGIKYFQLKDDDEVVSISFLKTNNSQLVSITKFGFVIRYNLNSITLTGINSSGVKSISLIEKDRVIKSLAFANSSIKDGNEQITFITSTGKAKRIRVSDLVITRRAQRGKKILKDLKAYDEYIVNMFDANKVKNVKVLNENNEYHNEHPRKMVLLSNLQSGFSKVFNFKILETYETILEVDHDLDLFEKTEELKTSELSMNNKTSEFLSGLNLEELLGEKFE